MPKPHRNRLTSRVAMAALLLSSTLPAALAAGLDSTLIERIDCSALTSQPCFRITLRVVGGQQLPSADPATLLTQFQVSANGAAATPFHLQSLSATPSAGPRSRVTLLLLDISGSMNPQQYSAALQAAKAYVADLDPAADVVGVATFGSRNVISGVHGAPYGRTVADLTKIIDALPKPERRNNTALYSAVVAGLEWVENWIKNNNNNKGLSGFLVVFTDGRNDVQAGDDPGLLKGAAGLQAATERIATSPVQVIPIGLARPGDTQSISEAELRALGAGRTRIVTAGADLSGAFQRSRQYTLSDLQLSVVLTNAGQSLTGRDVRFRVEHAAGLSGEGVWRAPGIGPSVSDVSAKPEEMEALRGRLENLQMPANDLWDLLRPWVVLAGWIVLLLILYYLMPKAIWPDAEAEIYQTAGSSGSSGRRAGDSSPGTERPGRSSRDETAKIPK